MNRIILFLALISVAPPVVADEETVIVDVTSSESREKILDEMGDLYGGMVNDALNNVIRHAPEQDREYLAARPIHIVTQDVPFGFFAGPDRNNESAIHVTVGGVRALHQVCVAMSLSVDHLNDHRWFMQYLLYVRKCWNHQVRWIADPTRAAGIRPADLPPSVVTNSTAMLMSGLTFILAHEAGHVALKHRSAPRPGEGASERLNRVRQQEGDADQYALGIMRRMQTVPVGGAISFIAFLLTQQRSVQPSAGATHPPDHRRIARMSRYVREHIDDFYRGELSKEQVLDPFVKAESMAQQIDSGELDLTDLDGMAEGITLDSLMRN